MTDAATRVFVAGHRGLIGSALVRRLKLEGCTNILTRSRSQLDLMQEGEVSAFFARYKPHIVFLAAGKVGGIVENQRIPADFIIQNLSIQINVLRAAHAAGVQKLVFFGSSCMYPRECPQPMAEDLILTGKPEETSLPYAISKLAGVHMCLALNKQYGETRYLPVIPNSTYGPNDDFDTRSSHVLAALIRKIDEARQTGARFVELWGSGTPCREFIHADDVADACWYLLQQDVSKLEFPINIGTGAEQSIRELAATIARILRYEGEIRWDASKPDGAPRKLLDNSRLRVLGWKPTVNLEDGIRRTYEWYLENKDAIQRDTLSA